MSISDPIADFITVLRNASKAKKEKITTGSSKMLSGICSILKDEKYIENFKVVEEGNKSFLRVQLKYDEGGEGVIHHVSRVSTPGLRKYVPSKEIPRVLGGIGTAILSTSKGIYSGRKAKKENLGGELLIQIW